MFNGSSNPLRSKALISRPQPQSAVVPYRRSGGDLRVLLITSRTTGRWIVPKGMIEPGFTPANSAIKEAFEEAGVLGVVDGGCLGFYRYMKRRPGSTSHCTVQVYPLRVTAVLIHWPECRERRRAWMSVAEAQARVREPDLRRILERFCSLRELSGGSGHSRDRRWR